MLQFNSFEELIDNQIILEKKTPDIRFEQILNFLSENKEKLANKIIANIRQKIWIDVSKPAGIQCLPHIMDTAGIDSETVLIMATENSISSLIPDEGLLTSNAERLKFIL